MRQGQFADQAARATGTEGVSQIFQEIGDSLGEVQLHPPMSHQYDAAAMVASSEPMTVETVLPAPPKARATKASASKPTPARSAKAAPARPARSPAATPMTVKAPSRVKAARVAVPAKAKPIAKPKAPVKPTSAKAVAAKVPRAPVQRAKPVAATKARSRK